MNISARRRPQHLWDLKCTRAVAQREDGWFKSKGSWFVATVVSEMKMGSSISIVVLWLKYIKVPLVLDEPWFLHVFNLNFRPESSLDPGFLDESCLNLWCIYGYEIFMETTTDLNRYHISSHIYDLNGWIMPVQDEAGGLPWFSQDLWSGLRLFRLGPVECLWESGPKTGATGGLALVFFTFQRGRAWQYMAIILIVLPYI